MREPRASFGFKRLLRGASRAAHAGFPWAAAAGQGHSPALRAALRRSVIGQYPPLARPAARLVMSMLWPFESLRDAVLAAAHARKDALAGHGRGPVALGAWGAALRHNLPPVDFVAYRLFERGRPPPPSWLHSADAHCHFAALAAPAVRALARDKLAFLDLAADCGAPVVPILAASGPDGPVRAFEAGAAPPRPLVVKPRQGHGAAGLDFWKWDGAAHVLDGQGVDGARGQSFDDWFARRTAKADLIVQPWAAPPAVVGGLEPSEAPVISILTAEWPDGRRALVLAQLLLVIANGGVPQPLHLEVDLASGRVARLTPGSASPIWRSALPPPSPAPFRVPGWAEMIAAIARVHAALPGAAPVLKWDALWTQAGLRLLEVNTGPGVFAFQATTLKPLTRTPLGEALEAWAA